MRQPYRSGLAFPIGPQTYVYEKCSLNRRSTSLFLHEMKCNCQEHIFCNCTLDWDRFKHIQYGTHSNMVYFDKDLRINKEI